MFDLQNSFYSVRIFSVRSPSPERPNKASVYNAYGRPDVLSNVTEKCSRTWVSSLLTATFTLASLFSLLQAPVVYSCVAGVEGGRGIGGREKGRGVGKRVPFPFCDASDFAIRRNSSQQGEIKLQRFSLLPLIINCRLSEGVGRVSI